VVMKNKQATRTVTVVNHDGFHLRAAVLLITLARRFESAVSVVKGNRVVDGKSTPLHLLGLDADQGESLELRAIGPDADEALDALVELFASGFEESPSPGHPEKVAPSPGRRKRGRDG
jgi:phosphotransferase system HPr (HPr) family protein